MGKGATKEERGKVLPLQKGSRLKSLSHPDTNHAEEWCKMFPPSKCQVKHSLEGKRKKFRTRDFLFFSPPPIINDHSRTCGMLLLYS